MLTSQLPALTNDVPRQHNLELSCDRQFTFPTITEGRYEVFISRSTRQTLAALSLRHRVFNVEMAGPKSHKAVSGVEFDEYDLTSRHLIVIDRASRATVGTYRLNTLETVRRADRFYSANEFSINDLPYPVLRDGVEIGRACIAIEHRNTKVLFLLWKGLLAYLQASDKNYFFGCCSIFDQDPQIARRVYSTLLKNGAVHDRFSVTPLKNGIDVDQYGDEESVQLPALFNMYLRLGAKVCGPPMIDKQFGTIDFFVVLDVREVGDKYRRMFGVHPS